MVLLWNSASKRLTMANAGSEPPLICRGGEIIKPHIEGVPIGLLDNRVYEEIEFQAESGDLILLYSDGVEDQLNESGLEFGRERIERILSDRYETPTELIASGMLHEIDLFREGAPLTDDQTLIAIRVR
jgi:sigma-B regulation protein RsbU (phosphoserine phosphatase)